MPNSATASTPRASVQTVAISKPVYLDYAATTPVAPEVVAAMQHCLSLDGNFANPASRSHLYGWRAEEAVENARSQVADLINADPREIVWTSGATEANNLALKGAAEAYRATHKSGGHIITSAIEHKAVLDPLIWLEAQGFTITRLTPNREGIIESENLRNALREDTFLVSIMLVNNELGSINPIQSIAALVKNYGILLHCDAAQAAGKIVVDVKNLGVDLLSLSAHKFYGPKGIGVLYVRRANDVKIVAQMHGGGHERNLRSGTLATHQCVGMGEAAQLVQKNIALDSEKIAQLRDALWNGIADLPQIQRNGSTANCVSGILNISFSQDDPSVAQDNLSVAQNKKLDGETLLLALRDLAISSGSACNSATMSPSYVLKAIGLSDAQSQSSLRFSLGRYTTQTEIDFAIEHIRSVILKLRKIPSP